MDMVKAEKVVFDYIRRNDEGGVEGVVRALDDVNLEVQPGDFIAILGHNGSGKSTLAKHINSILQPTTGTVWVNGIDTSDKNRYLEVRESAGMVFQNPDNQIIGTVVEEDVGFGPENIGVPTEEIWERVEKSLSDVGMLNHRYDSPNKLSGGQKQRVAIAGIMAMRPKCIVLDEPTAMLDPIGRRQVLKTIRELNQTQKVTIILITHYMEEAILADRVIVMDDGKIILTGTPKQVFSHVELLKQHRLDVPQVTQVAYELKKHGIGMPDGILTVEEFAEAFSQAVK